MGFALLCSAGPASAGGPVAALAMGAHFALADGAMALARNPANLGHAGAPACNVELFAVGAEFSNNGLGWDLYGRTTDAVISEEDKLAILEAIPDTGWELRAKLRGNALGFQAGNFAIASRAEISTNGTIPEEAVELFLYGNAVVDSVQLSESEGELLALASVDLGFALPLVRAERAGIYAGFNLRWLEALGYARLREMEGSLITRPDGVQANLVAEAVMATGGRGFAGDAGLALDLDNGWRAGVAVQNVLGRLRIDRGQTLQRYTAAMDSASLADLGDSGSLLQVEHSESRRLEEFELRLPRALRTGLAYRGARFALALDYESPLSAKDADGAAAIVAVGIEWKAFAWLPLRAGYASGGTVGRSASVGMGLHMAALHWDLALNATGPRLPEDAHGVGLATGLRLNF